MKILALEKESPGSTAEDFRPYLRAEAYRAWELYQTGVIRELYFNSDQHTAILMLECDSLDEGRNIINTLPLVKESLIDFELIPLIPYSGFSRLFFPETTPDIS